MNAPMNTDCRTIFSTIWTHIKRAKTKSSILDCLWGELYGSINLAEISEGVITPEHAEYLRKKYLWEGAKA